MEDVGAGVVCVSLAPRPLGLCPPRDQCNVERDIRANRAFSGGTA